MQPQCIHWGNFDHILNVLSAVIIISSWKKCGLHLKFPQKCDPNVFSDYIQNVLSMWPLFWLKHENILNFVNFSNVFSMCSECTQAINLGILRLHNEVHSKCNHHLSGVYIEFTFVDTFWMYPAGHIVSGDNPLQLQGGPTCPGGRDACREGGVEGQVDSAPSQLDGSWDKAVSQEKSQARRPAWEGSRERGATPCHWKD